MQTSSASSAATQVAKPEPIDPAIAFRRPGTLRSCYGVKVRYEEDARTLWQTYVPKRGQADTVRGELMRAVEKLRDEAERNGNVNWGKNHVLLAEYLRDTPTRSGLFDEAATAEIQRDIARLLDYNYPETSDEPYDRITDHIVEWARAHPRAVPRQPNGRLKI